MTEAETFRCNLPSRKKRRNEQKPPTLLKTFGSEPNIDVKLHEIARVLVPGLNERLIDLVELAACVYAADGAIPRGRWLRDGSDERWDRRFRLEVGVRDLSFWRSPGLAKLIEHTLSLLSGDAWE